MSIVYLNYLMMKWIATYSHTRVTNICARSLAIHFLVFGTWEGLLLKSVHDKEFNFTCDICYKKSDSKDSLTVHIGKHTWKLKHLNMKHVRKKFLFETNLRRHELGNSSKAFQANKSLRHHSLIHKAPQNMCTVCGKSFVWKPSFREHIKMCHT